jgi:hypothetical protein
MLAGNDQNASPWCWQLDNIVKEARLSRLAWRLADSVCDRLEAATCRLEDIAQAQLSSGQLAPQHPLPSAPLPAAVAPAAALTDAPALKDYKALLDGPLSEFLKHADAIGNVVSKQVSSGHLL